MIKFSISFIAVLLLSGCAHHKLIHAPANRLYVVVDVDITDVEKYDKFLALEAPILKKYDSYVAMDIRSEDQKRRYIIVSFPDSETLDNFVKSEEFQKILPLNKESATSKIFHGYQHGG